VKFKKKHFKHFLVIFWLKTSKNNAFLMFLGDF